MKYPFVSKDKNKVKGKSDYKAWKDVMSDDDTDWEEYFTGKYKKKISGMDGDWNLPSYKSKEFYDVIKKMKISIPDIKRTKMYKNAVKNGFIKNDKWVGKNMSENSRFLEYLKG